MSQDINLTCARCGYFGGLHACEPKITSPAPVSHTVEAANTPGVGPVEMPPSAGEASVEERLRDAERAIFALTQVCDRLTHRLIEQCQRTEQIESQNMHMNRRLLLQENAVVRVPVIGTAT